MIAERMIVPNANQLTIVTSVSSDCIGLRSVREALLAAQLLKHALRCPAKPGVNETIFILLDEGAQFRDLGMTNPRLIRSRTQQLPQLRKICAVQWVVPWRIQRPWVRRDRLRGRLPVGRLSGRQTKGDVGNIIHWRIP